MSSTILALRKSLSLQRTVYASRYASKAPRCDAHMNELPIPCGPWDALESKRQSFYMKHLLFGAAWWIFSLSMAIYTDSIYLNWSPPAMPGPPSDMVEECDDSEN